MRKIFIILASLFLLQTTSFAQPRYDMGKLLHEKLDRGVIAIHDGDKVVVSWRTLASDRIGEPFDIYRNGSKLNKQPLTKGGTFFTDTQPLTTDAVYEIRGGSTDGAYTLKADARLPARQDTEAR